MQEDKRAPGKALIFDPAFVGVSRCDVALVANIEIVHVLLQHRAVVGALCSTDGVTLYAAAPHAAAPAKFEASLAATAQPSHYSSTSRDQHLMLTQVGLAALRHHVDAMMNYMTRMAGTYQGSRWASRWCSSGWRAAALRCPAFPPAGPTAAAGSLSSRVPEGGIPARYTENATSSERRRTREPAVERPDSVLTSL